MSWRTWIALFLAALASACSSGGKKTTAEAGGMPPAPQMAQLELMIGTWEGTAEMLSPMTESMMASMPEGVEMPSSMAGEMTSEWSLGGHFMKSEGWHEMAPGMVSSFVEYIAWDAGMGRFRTFYFSDMGECGQGWWTPSADGRSFDVQSSGSRPDGSSMNGTGTFTFTDDDTMEWTWQEALPDGMMEMRGTSMRVR